jgi:adenine-specific DNA-methyltransferase
MGAGVEFANPKPCSLLAEMLRMATEPNDTVLDFFGGAASTAEAVYQLNHEDGGARRFLLVQLPEPTHDPKLPTIAELAKERIRRAAKKVTSNTADELDLDDNREPEDLGFRVFKLAESHFRRWKGAPDNTWASAVKEMELFVDPLLEGWRPDGVLYEIILREGFSLTSRVIPLADVKTNRVLRVQDPDKDQAFVISLDDEIKDATLKALKLGKNDRIILRDVALTDTQIANLALQCRLKTI